MKKSQAGDGVVCMRRKVVSIVYIITDVEVVGWV